jgi:hypothetical protein
MADHVTQGALWCSPMADRSKSPGSVTFQLYTVPPPIKFWGPVVCGPRASGVGPILLGPGHSKDLVIAVLLGKVIQTWQ